MFASELRYQTPPVLGKIANIATKKDDLEGRVLPNGYNRRISPEYHLKVSYQTHQRHSHIRSAIFWSIKRFDTQHNLRRALIYLPKLFFV